MLLSNILVVEILKIGIQDGKRPISYDSSQLNKEP